MRFRLIDEEAARHPVSLLCNVLGVTRAGYYAWKRRPASRHATADAALKVVIRQIYDGAFGIYGAPRIHAELADEHGIRTSRKRVARLMRELGVAGVSRRRTRRTTIPDAACAAAPDLVNRVFTATRPDETWVADITYIPTSEGWLFLAAIVDLYSRKVVGWSMRDNLEAGLVVDAVSMAITRRRPPAGLVHHSDRGSQYTSLALGKTLRDCGIIASMGSRGDAYDNAAAESFISTIKNEWLSRHRFQTRDQARIAVFRYIETFYNPRRRHSTLGQQSPDTYEKIHNHKADAA